MMGMQNFANALQTGTAPALQRQNEARSDEGSLKRRFAYEHAIAKANLKLKHDEEMSTLKEKLERLHAIKSGKFKGDQGMQDSLLFATGMGMDPLSAGLTRAHTRYYDKMADSAGQKGLNPESMVPYWQYLRGLENDRYGRMTGARDELLGRLAEVEPQFTYDKDGNKLTNPKWNPTMARTLRDELDNLSQVTGQPGGFRENAQFFVPQTAESGFGMMPSDVIRTGDTSMKAPTGTGDLNFHQIDPNDTRDFSSDPQFAKKVLDTYRTQNPGANDQQLLNHILVNWKQIKSQLQGWGQTPQSGQSAPAAPAGAEGDVLGIL
jgi:hypothetical protein